LDAMHITCGLYYKLITIVNDDSSVVSKWMLQTVASLIDDARVVIYDRNMFIIDATGGKNQQLIRNHLTSASCNKMLFEQMSFRTKVAALHCTALDYKKV
jgi:hypothetical protein